MQTYRMGLIYGIISCIVLSILSLIPIENLITTRPPSYISYTPPSYLYLWRLSTLTLITIILTLTLLYVHGSRKFYIGILDVQIPFYIVVHYVYLYIMTTLFYGREGILTILPFIYIYGKLIHVDFGQIASIYLVYRVVKHVIIRRRSNEKILKSSTIHNQ